MLSAFVHFPPEIALIFKALCLTSLSQIAIEGNIAAGKSTLLEKLKELNVAQVIVEPVEQWQNVIEGAVITFVDITEMKQAKDELSRAHETLGLRRKGAEDGGQDKP